MAKDPIHYLAGAVRTLQKRIDELEALMLMPKPVKAFSTDPWTSPLSFKGSWVPCHITLPQVNALKHAHLSQPINNEIVETKEYVASEIVQTSGVYLEEHTDEQVVQHSTPVELCPDFGWTCPSTGIPKSYSAAPDDSCEELMHMSSTHDDVLSIPGCSQERSDKDQPPSMQIDDAIDNSESVDVQCPDDHDIPAWQLLGESFQQGLDKLEGIGSLALMELLDAVVDALSTVLTIRPRSGVRRKDVVTAAAFAIIRFWNSRYSVLLFDHYEEVVKNFGEAAHEALDLLLDA